jgi:hypothetical protein
MGCLVFVGVCLVVQENWQLEIMRRDGAESMKRSKQWRQMGGSWMKRNGRIFRRLLEEVNGGLVKNFRRF